MKSNRLIYCPLLSLIFIGCTERKKCEMRIIDSQTIDKTTMYAIYSSDTCWEKMVSYTDSITVANKASSDYTMAIFIYPEDKVPKFKANSFAVEGSDYYVIMEVFDSNQIKPPYHIVKYPERYTEAKKVEKAKK